MNPDPDKPSSHIKQIRSDVCRSMTLDLNLLREFIHVTEVGSLPEAAADLGHTPVILGNRMAMLEEALGGRLLTSGPEGVRPTPRAGRSLPYLRLALSIVDAFRNRPATDPAGSVGNGS